MVGSAIDYAGGVGDTVGVLATGAIAPIVGGIAGATVQVAESTLPIFNKLGQDAANFWGIDSGFLNRIFAGLDYEAKKDLNLGEPSRPEEVLNKINESLSWTPRTRSGAGSAHLIGTAFESLRKVADVAGKSAQDWALESGFSPETSVNIGANIAIGLESGLLLLSPKGLKVAGKKVNPKLRSAVGSFNKAIGDRVSDFQARRAA